MNTLYIDVDNIILDFCNIANEDQSMINNLHILEECGVSTNRGTYKVRNEIETKRNEINEKKRNQRKRNETKSTKTKRNEINEMETK